MANLDSIILYGVTALVSGGLIYSGFFLEQEADTGTLLGSAEMQLRLAASMPRHDKDGKVVAGRKKLLREAEGFLDRLERNAPDLPEAFELRAHMFYLRGEYRQAAETYASARKLEKATPELRDLFCLNEARLWRASKDHERSRKVLEGHEFLPKNSAESRIGMARTMFALEQPKKAIEFCNTVVEGGKNPTAMVTAGLLLEQSGDLAAAEKAFEAAEPGAPLASYYRARLKLQQRDFDSAMSLLERATKARERQVRSLVQQDQEIWAPCADRARFKQLFEADESAPDGR